MTKRLICLCFVLLLSSCVPNPAKSTSTPLPIPTEELTPTAHQLPSLTPTSTTPAKPTLTSTQKITVTASPTRTIPPAFVEACPGAPDTLLKIGDWAMVSMDPPLPNKIRSQPGVSGEIIGWVQPGENVLVVDGPRCSDNYTWWYVRNLSGLEGWTVEGDSSGYWLVDPIYAWYQLPNPLNSQGVKTYDLRELKISADQALIFNITGSYNSLATPMPRPQTPDTPEPNDPRYSPFGTSSYAAHSFYAISGAVENPWLWVFDLTDPLSRYYLNNQSYNDCTEALRDTLENDVIVTDYLKPFCGVNGGIPLLFKAGVKPIQFTGGKGVRYLYASGNYQTVDHLEYRFQGLSDDGHYYISGIFRPILHPYILEDRLYNADFGWLLEWKEGQYEQAQKSYERFNARIEELLNAEAVTLYPSLEFLDQMMASIVIK